MTNVLTGHFNYTATRAMYFRISREIAKNIIYHYVFEYTL